MLLTSINGEQINLFFDNKTKFWIWTYKNVKYVSKQKPVTDQDVMAHEWEVNRTRELADNMLINYLISNISIT